MSLLSPPPQRWQAEAGMSMNIPASPPPGASPQAPANFAADAGNFTSLDEAGRKISNCIKDDDKVKDLYEVLQEPDCQSYQLRGWPPLIKQAGPLVELPQLVRERYNSCQSGICFCGVFPAIRRAWATVDNSLFLWRFDKRDDVPVEYSGEEQAICAVGLAKPRAGVFITAIQHLLILATPVEIVLLGVCCGKGKISGDEFEELTLQPLPLYTIPSDNVVVGTIVSTKNGRIFLGGGDGHLYELLYSSGEGWRQRRCSKVCCSAGLSWLLPSFLRLRPASPTAQLAVDEDRGVLYTRSQSSCVAVYDMGPNGDEPLGKVLELTDVAGAMGRVARGRDFLGRGAMEAAGSRGKKGSAVVHIAPISPSESTRLQLVVITADGRRAYFSIHSDSQLRFERSPRPSRLECKRVCSPPQRPQQPRGAGPSDSLLAEVECAYYGGGVLVLSETTTAGGADSVVLLVSRDAMQPAVPGDYGRALGSGGLRETVADLKLVGQCCALGELEPPGALANAIGGGAGGAGGRHELATQHLLPPRRFVAVTTAGLQVVIKCRPVDMLQQLLEDGGAEDARLFDFFKGYGQKEAAAMCLLLATSPAGASVSRQVVESARRAFADPKLSGEPQMDDGAPEWGGGGAGGAGLLGGLGSPGGAGGGAAGGGADGASPAFYMGHAVRLPTALFSGAHEGLCLYSARVLQPVWDRTLCHTAPDSGGMLRLRMAASTMQQLEERLRSLVAYLAEYAGRRRRAGASEVGGAGGGVLGGGGVASIAPLAPTGQRYHRREAQTKRQKIEDATVQEERSMAAIGALLQRAAQALLLLRLLSEHHFGRLVLRLESAARAEVGALTFRGLMSSQEGDRLASLLITALMSSHVEDAQGWVDELAAQLQAGCPLFFKEEDRTFYRARELLARAHAAESPGREQLASRALELLLQVPRAVNLPAVVPELEELHCYEGVVQLPLRCAAAHAAAAEGAREGTPAHASAVAARDACYKVITETVESLVHGRPTTVVVAAAGSGAPSGRRGRTASEGDRRKWLQQVLALAAKSSDRAFHERLYASLAAMGQDHDLLALKAPYLDDYLRRRAGWPGPSVSLAPDAVHHAELLAKLYTERFNFSGAAQVLLWLAERRGGPASGSAAASATLEERQAYLRSAVLQAKSQGGHPMAGPGGLAGMASGGGPAAQLLDRAEAQLRVVGFQRRLLGALRAGGAGGAAAGVSGLAAPDRASELEWELKTLTELYNDFAFPLKVYDLCLEMADFAGGQDAAVMADLWDRHLTQGVDAALAGGRGGAGALAEACDRTVRLGESLYPSEASFPRAHVAFRLEEVAAGIWPAAMAAAASAAAAPDPRAVPEALLAACRRSHELLRQLYDELLARRGGELADPRLRLQLLRSLLYVVKGSAEGGEGAGGGAAGGGGAGLFGGAGAGGHQGGRLGEHCERYIQEVRRLQVPSAHADEVIAGFAQVRDRVSGGGW